MRLTSALPQVHFGNKKPPFIDLSSFFKTWTGKPQAEAQPPDSRNTQTGITGDGLAANHRSLSCGLGGLFSKPQRLQLPTDIRKTLGGISTKLERQEYERLSHLAAINQQYGNPAVLLPLVKELTKAEKPNIAPLELAVLKDFFTSHGIPVGEIHPSQAGKWLLEYTGELSAELSPIGGKFSSYRPALVEICQAALAGRYYDYLHAPNSPVGQANTFTQKEFQELGLDYNTWMNFKGTVRYQKHNYNKALDSIVETAGEILTTLSTPSQAIKAELADMGFEFNLDRKLRTIQSNISRNKVLQLLTDLPLLIQYSHHKPGFSKEEKTSMLSETLVRLETTLQKLKSDNTADMEIRLWKRNPGHDLFQANLTGSCIALGYGRGEGSLQAIQHTCVQLAECFNEREGKVTGKALFFWARDLNSGNPVMVLNTFEGRADGGEEDLQTRESLLEFAKEYSKAVAGKEVKILTAYSPWNTLRTFDLPKEMLNLQPIGETVTGDYYLDTFSGTWEPYHEPHPNTTVYVLHDPDV